MDGAEVGDNPARKANVVLEDLVERGSVLTRPHAIDLVEGAHYAAGIAFSDGDFIRQGVDLVQGSFVDVRRGTVATDLLFVGNVMLENRLDRNAQRSWSESL